MKVGGMKVGAIWRSTVSNQCMEQPPATEAGRGDGAGWPEQIHRYRPKAQFFGMLSLLWILPSVGAVVILSLGPRAWIQAGTLIEGLRGVRIEEWIAVALLVIHPAFVWLAWRYRRTEPFKEIVLRKPEAGQHAREPD